MFRLETAGLQIGHSGLRPKRRQALVAAEARRGRVASALASSQRASVARHAATTGNDSATRTSSSSNPPSQHRLVGRERCAVRTARVTNWQVIYKLESHYSLERPCCAARVQSQTLRWLFDELTVYSTNCSSALNLRNTPNPLPARRLQQRLGGEYHETCFCTCWPRRTWRGCVIQRGRIGGADRRPVLDDGNRCTARLRLQRMGPLLAPPL
jgi:hypothetical protein